MPGRKRGVLTAKQAAFVEEYLVDLNATAAAQRAGFSKKSSATQGIQLLQKKHVAAAVKKAQEERADRTHITADRVLREIALLAFSDVSHYEVNGDELELVEGAPAAAKRAVSSLKVKSWTSKDGEEHLETEFRLWDKPSALKLLCSHLGICTEKRELGVTGSLYDLICGVKAEEAAEKK
jgi:phage terminase small subunit